MLCLLRKIERREDLEETTRATNSRRLVGSVVNAPNVQAQLPVSDVGVEAAADVPAVDATSSLWITLEAVEHLVVVASKTQSMA